MPACNRWQRLSQWCMFCMDDFKHSSFELSDQINVSLVKRCLQKGDAKLALHYCHLLLANDPNQLDALLLAAIAARGIGWTEEAYSHAHSATVVAPDQPAPFSLLGDILLVQKKPDIALDVLLHAKTLGDCTPQALFNIGLAYLNLEKIDKAKSYFNQALAINPNMVEALVNKGLVEHSLMNLESAIKCFDSAIRLDSDNVDAQWNKSHVLLTLGRYQEGFKLYETRWKNPKVRLIKRPFGSPLWLGQEDLSGKTILLSAEGGFGDTLQFIRYAKLFKRDVKLIIQCQVPLIEIIHNMGLVAEIIAPGDLLPEHDFHCPLMSLPFAFGTTRETTPKFLRYIYSDVDQRKKWSSEIGKLGGLKIGIMARGSGSFQEDRRSLELEKLIDYLPKNASFVLLQKELNDFEKGLIESQDHWIAPCLDFSGTAAVCDLLDLVISVDTSILHLAAGMGKPTILLLPFRPDWRWGVQSDETVWYPECLLLRQIHRNDWTSVLESIPRAVYKLASKHSKIQTDY